jgi:P27 family predicted phage terminase small subunit
MGRSRKPTALRLIQGNPGHRPIPTNEPKPVSGIPSCPKHLNAEAKTEWRRITKELKLLGLLTKVDRAALACYCQAWARLVDAEGHLNSGGAVVEGRQEGKVKSPWLVVAHQSMDFIRKFGVEFGLTPSSRGRLEVPGEKEESLDVIAKRRAAANRAQWEREAQRKKKS